MQENAKCKIKIIYIFIHILKLVSLLPHPCPQHLFVSFCFCFNLDQKKLPLKVFLYMLNFVFGRFSKEKQKQILSKMVNLFKIKVRNLAKGFMVISVLYILLIRKITRKAEFNLLIPNAKSEDVWNVMADFR